MLFVSLKCVIILRLGHYVFKVCDGMDFIIIIMYF